MVAQQFDEWADFPKPAQLYKQDSWMHQLVSRLRRMAATLDSLDAATSATSDGSGSVVLGTNIGNYGSGYQPLEAVRTRDGLVHVSGLIRNNTGGAVADGTVIAQLPLGYRPVAIVMSVGPRTGVVARADINTSGQIITREFNWPNSDFLWIEATFRAA